MSAGIVFLFFTHGVFDELSLHVKALTAALDYKGTHKFNLSIGADLIAHNIFGKRYVQLYDGQHLMILNDNEWRLLEDSLPLLWRLVSELFYTENNLRSYH